MTNIYTNNANTNDSAKNTLDFFENYNKQQINLKSSDIDQFQSLLVKKGMQELAARETTTLILNNSVNVTLLIIWNTYTLNND